MARNPITELYPRHRETTVYDALSGLALGDRAPDDRPYVVLNMVSTLDGWATLEGRTEALGSRIDATVFNHLRTQVDAVMVGAGTVRTEGYGRMIRRDALRKKRVDEGFGPNPLAVIVSGRLALPPHLPLLQDPDSDIVILTGPEGELQGTAARIEYLRGSMAEGRLELAPFLRTLRERGVRSIVCEGGPAVNAALFDEGLVDELFLCLYPKVVVGRDPLTIATGLELPAPVDFELVSVYTGGGDVFVRHRVARG